MKRPAYLSANHVKCEYYDCVNILVVLFAILICTHHNDKPGIMSITIVSEQSDTDDSATDRPLETGEQCQLDN